MRRREKEYWKTGGRKTGGGEGNGRRIGKLKIHKKYKGMKIGRQKEEDEAKKTGKQKEEDRKTGRRRQGWEDRKAGGGR